METVVQKEDQGSKQERLCTIFHRSDTTQETTRLWQFETSCFFWGIFVFSFILEKSVENLEKG